jgi:hypothetical protein
VDGRGDITPLHETVFQPDVIHDWDVPRDRFFSFDAAYTRDNINVKFI